MIVIATILFAAALVWFYAHAYGRGYRRGLADVTEKLLEMRTIAGDAVRDAEDDYRAQLEQIRRHYREACALATRLAEELRREKERARRPGAPT